MKKILLIDSSYPINVRNNKIVKTIEPFDSFEISVISWNRDNRKNIHYLNCKEYIYTSDTPYGIMWRKIVNLIPYSFFVRKKIKEIKPDYIIASHWDMLFITSLLKNKRSKLIYENIDMPTASNLFLYKILKNIEKYSLKKTDTIIFSSRFFTPEYDFFKREKYIIENKPFKNIEFIKPAVFKHDSTNMKLSFIGELRYFDVMKNVMSAIKDLPIDLLFFGDGPDIEKFKKFAHEYSNVFLLIFISCCK
jgi:hypothetical protein